MKTLISTLILGAGFVLGGCGNKELPKECLSQTYFDSLIENNKLKSIDSVALDNSVSIKITKEGFKQYNNGLLIRELEIDEYIDNFYNDKNQKIKSIGSIKYKDEKTGKEKIEKTDSTFYEYNDKGHVIKTKIFGGAIGIDYNGKKINFQQTNFYKYDEKGNKIEEITDENEMIWIDKYQYNDKGKLIKKENINPNGERTYFLFPNDFTEIALDDKNSDGLIDEVNKIK